MARYQETNPPPEPRQIFGIRDTFGKNQSSWIDASCGGFLPEIVLNRFIACNEPYHAAANAVQDSHPNIKYGRGNLVVVVEAAKHKGFSRKAQLLACEMCLRKYGGFDHWPGNYQAYK